MLDHDCIPKVCPRCKGKGELKEPTRDFEIRCVRFAHCGHSSVMKVRHLSTNWDLDTHKPQMSLTLLPGEPGAYSKSWIAFWLRSPRRDGTDASKPGAIMIHRALYGPYFLCADCVTPIAIGIGKKFAKGYFSGKGLTLDPSDLADFFGEGK